MQPTLTVVLLKLQQYENNQTLHREMIMDKLAELDIDIKELKKDTITASKELKDDHHKRLEDIEKKRLPTLEHWKSSIGGAILILGGVAAIFGWLGGIFASIYSKDTPAKIKTEILLPIK